MTKKDIEKRFTKNGLKDILNRNEIDFNSNASKLELVDLVFNQMSADKISTLFESKVAKDKKVKLRTTIFTLFSIIGLFLGIWADGDFAFNEILSFNKKQPDKVNELDKRQAFLLRDSSDLKILFIEMSNENTCKNNDSHIQEKVLRIFDKELNDGLLSSYKILTVPQQIKGLTSYQLQKIGLEALANIVVSGSNKYDCIDPNNDSILLNFSYIPYDFDFINQRQQVIKLFRADKDSIALTKFAQVQQRLFKGSSMMFLDKLKIDESKVLNQNLEKQLSNYLKNLVKYVNTLTYLEEKNFTMAERNSAEILLYSQSTKNELHRMIISNGIINDVFNRERLLKKLPKNEQASLFVYLSFLESAKKIGSEEEMKFYRNQIRTKYPCYEYYDSIFSSNQSKLNRYFHNEILSSSKLSCFSMDSIVYHLMQRNILDRKDLINDFKKIDNVMVEEILEPCISQYFKGQLDSSYDCFDRQLLISRKHNVSHIFSYKSGISFYLLAKLNIKRGDFEKGKKYLLMAKKHGYQQFSNQEVILMIDKNSA